MTTWVAARIDSTELAGVELSSNQNTGVPVLNQPFDPAPPGAGALDGTDTFTSG